MTAPVCAGYLGGADRNSRPGPVSPPSGRHAAEYLLIARCVFFPADEVRMTIATPSPVRGRHSQPSDYAALLSLVQAEGLMRRRYLYYAVKISLLVTALAAIAVGVLPAG